MKTKRNIGIIAHVDAGKTTVSERILYFTGAIHAKGEVHNGASTMDHTQWEKNHGITVTSAAITVSWNDCEISMIDTPGHIDFNIEVKRALRVLDGAIVVFDAVAGVEPQTETNWRLADEFNVPRIAFINKMDRDGASFERTRSMIEERFGVTTLSLQIPIGDPFNGVIDVIDQQALTWAPGAEKPTRSALDATQAELCANARNELVETLAMLDDEILDLCATGNVPAENLRSAIARVTAKREAVALLCGSALKDLGVQPLLDAIVDYLPAPDTAAHENNETLVFAFKTVADKHQDQVFCRVYHGTVHAGDTVWNTNAGKRERISRLHLPAAGELQAIESATAGDIIVLTGMKHTSMGHTLSSVENGTVLENLTVPEPVTSMAVEAVNSDQRDKMIAGLLQLQAEDPSLHLNTHPETGQTLLSGMGELHLLMACEKLEALTHVEVRLGIPEVFYRETVSAPATIDFLLNKQNGGPGQYAGVTFEITPLERGEGFVFESNISGGVIPQEFIPAVEKGVRQRLLNGVLAGHPVVDVKVVLTDGKTHPNDSSAAAFERAGSLAMEKALHAAMPVLLEPVMKANVSFPSESSGAVIGDLSRRQGVICDQQVDGAQHMRLEALVPLAQLFGIADDLRSLTSGRSNFAMEFDSYAPVAG